MDNKTTKILAVILIAIIASVSIYATYNQFYKTPEPTTTPPQTTPETTPTTTNQQDEPISDIAEPEPKNVTVVDGSGRTITVTTPLKRVVVLDVGISDILYVMGAQDSIIGRCDTVISPLSILDIPSVGQNAYYLGAEAVLELNPDCIITDKLILYNEAAYEQLTNSGIPIWVTGTVSVAIDPLTLTPEELYNADTVIDHACDLMKDLTQIFGHEQQVNAYVEWAQSYTRLLAKLK